MQPNSRLLIAVSFVKTADPCDPGDLPLQPHDLVFDLSVFLSLPTKSKTATDTANGSLKFVFLTGLTCNCLVFSPIPYL